jgi:hypothetical protein
VDKRNISNVNYARVQLRENVHAPELNQIATTQAGGTNGGAVRVRLFVAQIRACGPEEKERNRQ